MFRSFVDLGRVHFVGIGGTGMSGIAEVLLDYELEIACIVGKTGKDIPADKAADHIFGHGQGAPILDHGHRLDIGC